MATNKGIIMKLSNTIVRKFLAVIFLGGLVSMPVIALEIILEEDLVEGIVVEEQLVRVADNAIFLVDTSSSMDEKFRDTGKTKLELVSSEFKKRTGYFPDIGHKFGIYTYTPWQEYYPVRFFNREDVVRALDAIPQRASGPTPLKKGLEKLEDVLKSLSGRTAVFVFSDGEYTGGNPIKLARSLASNYDVCFYVISTAKVAQNNELGKTVAGLNSCSRMIPLEYYLNRPEYMSGALFDVVATEVIVTTTETRVAGVETKGINFAFGKTELDDSDKTEIDQIGQFMTANPESFAVIAGYTDSTGPEEFNVYLSNQRAEIVASYLMDEHSIDESRMVLQWYGSNNPLMSNETRAGREKNRRVEVAVGL
jgi:OOP family OmpA-OmpF porin